MNVWAARARKPHPSIIRRDQGGLSIERMLPQALRTRSAFWLVLLLPAAVVLAGCGSKPAQSAADLFGPPTNEQQSRPLSNQPQAGPLPDHPQAGLLPQQSQPESLTAQPQPEPVPNQPQPEQMAPLQDLTRWDNQGAVEISVVPLNMGTSGSEQLDFQIAMNTHSVDLSMDLARLASLENDRGVKVQADGWSGGSGHHVNGILSFPLRDSQGLAVLEGASFVVLRIESVDAPLREFRWEVGQNQ